MPARTLLVRGVTDAAGDGEADAPEGPLAGIVRAAWVDDGDLAAGASVSLLALDEEGATRSTTDDLTVGLEIPLIGYSVRISVTGGGAANPFRVGLLVEVDPIVEFA